MQSRSILTRIKRAESAEEIANLLKESELCEKASDKTRLRWAKKAAKRMGELENKE